MSKVIAAGPAHAAPPTASGLTGPLSRVRRIGYAVLALQLAGFLTWSTLLYHRFALTFDFSIYHQAWYEIAHGNLDPYNSEQGFPFWRTHCEFMLWPLALLYWVWPHDVVLLWLQDIGVARLRRWHSRGCASWRDATARVGTRCGPRADWCCWSPTHGHGGRSHSTSIRRR